MPAGRSRIEFVDEPAVETGQRVGIVAARLGAGADLGVAEIGEVGVVELKIAAAARREVGDFGSIGGGEVRVEILEIGIYRLADRLPPAAEMQHRRRGDADLRRPGDDRLQEIEIRPLDRRDPADLAADMHCRRPEADLGAVAPAEARDIFAVVGLDALEPLEKIHMEISAAELAVGDPLEADVLLRAHDLADAFVLDCMQVFRREAAGGEFLPRLPQALGTQEAADVVGAERRTGHGLLPGGVGFDALDRVTAREPLATRAGISAARRRRP